MMQGMIAPPLLFSPSSQDITIVAVVPYHLFTAIWHMGTHGSQPLQGIKGLGLFCVLSLLDNFALFPQVSHPLL